MNYEYCAGVTYTIKNGDTLYEISRRHGVPLALLLRANPYVDVFSLQAGDTICVPQKTKEELPYPMESPMQDSMEDSMEDSMDNSMGNSTGEMVENIMNQSAGRGSVGMRAGGMTGSNSPAGIQEGISGDNSSNGMQAGINSTAGMQGRTNSSTGMQAGTNGSAGMQTGSSSSAGMQGRTDSSIGMQVGTAGGNNNSAGMQGEMPDTQRGMNRTASQKAGNEQMDEMLVWSEQANSSGRKKSDSPSQGKKWCKYVVKPGDTLEDVLEDMEEDMDGFWEKNPASQLYLLPGVACYVCKK